MNFEKNNSFPEKNTLPLKTEKSEKHAEHGESTVWKTDIQDQEGLEKQIALKQIRKKEFATPEAMQADKKFYESLKNSPIGKFVPDTHFFIAKMTPDGSPQGFRVQKFIENESLDKFSDKELYKDKEIVKQLMELINGAMEILKSAKKDKKLQPDFRWAPERDKLRVILGGLLSDPRYTKNIIISNKPDENGQRVFFVDTGMNAQERTVKREELIARHIVNPLEQLHFKRWRRKLEDILESTE